MSKSFMAYVCLLLGFVALGTFVYAAATGSQLAAANGAVLVLAFTAAVVRFRAGSRQVAESNESGIPIEGANIWAKPLRRAQIDRYLSTYRDGSTDVETAPEDDVVGMTVDEYPRAA